ncbi:MAG: hypothetical protein Q8R64_11945, partial [Sulfurimicrobium sp.]|nr:hypothetical protein [Sulfurimicrobium sp.]
SKPPKIHTIYQATVLPRTLSPPLQERAAIGAVARVGRNNQRALRRMWLRSAHHPGEPHLPRSEAPSVPIQWAFPEPEQVEGRQQA